MKRKDFDLIEKENELFLEEQESWITLVRNFQKDAKRELYNAYQNLTLKEEKNHENEKKEKNHENEKKEKNNEKEEDYLTLFSSQNSNYILENTRDENIYIYRRPSDKRICYGPDMTEWPTNDLSAWPLSVKHQHIPEPPKDVWFLIFKNLTVEELLTMSSVNRTLNSLAKRDSAWYNLKLELLACVPAVDWFFIKHKNDSFPLWKAFLHMFACGTRFKHKFLSLDGSSRGNVMCVALNLTVPFGFENTFQRFKKPSEQETPSNFNSKMTIIWKLEGSNVCFGKKYRASSYSVLYNQDVGTQYWSNAKPWSYANLNKSYRNVMLCKSGNVYKTLCENSAMSNWEIFDIDRINYLERVQINSTLAKSKMTF